jgi:hypothetical protein
MAPRSLRVVSGSGEVPPIPLPKLSDIVFQHNLYDGDTTPQVGSSAWTYTRSGTIGVCTGLGQWTKFGANVLPVGVKNQARNQQMSGAYLGSIIINRFLHSEDFTNAAWVSVGGGSASSGSYADPFGGMNADIITGTADGDGLSQTTSRAVSNNTAIISIFMRVTSGTHKVRLKITNGGTEGGICDVIVNTQWQRYEFSHTFVTGVSGNIVGQILVGDGSVFVFGAQMEGLLMSGASTGVRYGGAHAYTPTTTGEATVGTAQYRIDNAIATAIATKGSFMARMCTSVDICTDYFASSEIPYILGCGGEKLSLSLSGPLGPRFWLSDSAVFGGTVTLDYTNVTPSDEWFTICVTWDTDTDVYRCFVNGVKIYENLTARGPANVGANHIFIGNTNNNNSGVDCAVSQVVIWDEALTEAEALQAYQTQLALCPTPTVPTGKIFEVDLGTSVIPTVGDTWHRWNTRGFGAPYFYNTPTTIAPSSPFEYPVGGRPLNGFDAPAFSFAATNINNLLYSEDISNGAWSAVGSPTINGSAGTFLGTMNYGTIAGDSGEGVEQTTAISAAVRTVNCSVFASVASGTVDFCIEVEGSSASVNTQTSPTFTATTTPQRFNFGTTVFAGGTGGNLKYRIKLLETGTLRVGGSHLQLRAAGNATQGNNLTTVTDFYMKTEAATVGCGISNIIYRGLNSFNINRGTLLAWGWLWVRNPQEWLPANGPVVLGMPGGNAKTLYLHILANMLNLGAWGLQDRQNPENLTLTPYQYYQYGFAWDCLIDGTPILKIYLNGVPVTTVRSGSFIRALTHRRMLIGGDAAHISHDTWQGGLGKISIWGNVLSDAQVLADFNANKASYGL